MNLKKAILLRSWIAFLLIFGLAIRIIWQIIDLQFNKKEKYLAISIEQSTKWRVIQASRGNIYADDGSLLATSIPKYELRMDTRVETITNEFFNANIDSLSWYFASEFTDKTQSEWRNYLVSARNRGERYLLLKRNVDYHIVKAMEQWPIFSLGKYKGGFIKIENFKREIPFGILAARSIGYVNREAKVKIGLEGTYDSLLSGAVGKRLERRVKGGVWRPVDNSQELDSRNGLDIYTTLDINIQDVAENALKKSLIANNADHGCAILMEVKTGAIKAIANLKRNSDNTCYEAENYAVNEFSDPGSTFKLISAMALLEDRYMKLSDSVDIEYGKTSFGPLPMVDAHISPYKYATLQYIFEHSSNVGIAKSIYKYYKDKPEQFLRFANSLGLNTSLPFDIKTTRHPHIRNTKDNKWSGTSLPFMSIGYEMELSSMQILSLYNAVANNGVMVKPYLVKEITEFGKSVKSCSTEVINPKICSEETLKQLKFLLEGVVERGTATNLKGLAYQVAGKTGTAQIISNGKYDKSSHKASFVGYFPANNPQYTCIVVVNAPANGIYYGGSVAGPVFKEIADKVYSTNIHLHQPIKRVDKPGMPKVKSGNRDDIKYVLNHLFISSRQIQGEAESEWVKASGDVQSIVLKEIQTDANQVPDVRGMGLRDALYLLENRGFRVLVQGYGSVTYQSIIAGTIIRNKGGTIYIKLSP
ncbi:MAG: PASTA domain-containing protein [Bacteroidia bacterium]|nr:PASTA domain-containing protein [Bacteroidia bacterium]